MENGEKIKTTTGVSVSGERWKVTREFREAELVEPLVHLIQPRNDVRTRVGVQVHLSMARLCSRIAVSRGPRRGGGREGRFVHEGLELFALVDDDRESRNGTAELAYTRGGRDHCQKHTVRFRPVNLGGFRPLSQSPLPALKKIKIISHDS